LDLWQKGKLDCQDAKRTKLVKCPPPDQDIKKQEPLPPPDYVPPF
jgi:hypothetical protein